MTIRAAPETLPAKIWRWFWKIWEKTSLLFFLAFVGLNLLAANSYGWPAVVRAWGAGFALIGVATLAWYWVATRRAEASKAWWPAQARILSSQVRVEVKRDMRSQPGYSGHMTYYFPEIVYEYEVQGLTYTSSSILFVRVNYSRADAEAAVARYPAGSRATAWVNPRNPRMAVLEPGLQGRHGKYARVALVGAAFTVLGAAVWFLLPAFVRA